MSGRYNGHRVCKKDGYAPGTNDVLGACTAVRDDVDVDNQANERWKGAVCRKPSHRSHRTGLRMKR